MKLQFYLLFFVALTLINSIHAVNPQINIVNSGNITEQGNNYILEKQILLEVYNPTNARIWNLNLSCDNSATWKDNHTNSVNCPIFINELQPQEKQQFFGKKSQTILEVSKSIVPQQVYKNEKTRINFAITIKNTLNKPINLTVSENLPGKIISSNGNIYKNKVVWKKELNKSKATTFYAYFENSFSSSPYYLPDAKIEITSLLNSTGNYSATALTTATNSVEKSKENGIWKARAIFSNPSQSQLNLTEIRLWEGNGTTFCNSNPCESNQYVVFTPNILLNSSQSWNSSNINYSVDHVPIFWSSPKFTTIFDKSFFANYTGKIKGPEIKIIPRHHYYHVSKPCYKLCLKNETIYYELHIEYLKNSTLKIFNKYNQPLINSRVEIIYPSGRKIIAYYHKTKPITFFTNELGIYNFSITAPSANKTCYNEVNFSAHLQKQIIYPNISLWQEDKYLWLFVKDQYKNPLPFFNLTITFPSGKKQNITTDENGSYILKLKESGKYIISTAITGYSTMIEYTHQKKVFCAQFCIIKSKYLPFAIILLALASAILSIKQKTHPRIAIAIGIISLLPIIPLLPSVCNMLCLVLYFLISYLILIVAYCLAAKKRV